MCTMCLHWPQFPFRQRLECGKGNTLGCLDQIGCLVHSPVTELCLWLLIDWEDYKECSECVRMNVKGGESCFSTVQETVEADVMERESEQTWGSLWSFELTLERIKRDAAVLTGLCCTASPDRSAGLLSMNFNETSQQLLVSLLT